MKIGRIYYPVKVLGYGNRLGIWVCGCNKNCIKCISPELKNIMSGKEMSVQEIIKFIDGINDEIDGVTISGGEPFLQDRELAKLTAQLKKYGIDDIIVYTGYTYDHLLKGNKNIRKILNNISVLIDGEYISELDDGKGIRGSANQNIYVFRYENRYTDAENCERNIQAIITNTHITYIGIPNNERK